MTEARLYHLQCIVVNHTSINRRLADNSERLRKIDDDIMKIRRNAVELLQMHQARNEVEGQVEALSSSITALQEQKAAALQKMRHSQTEEVRHYQSMRAAIKKVRSEAIFLQYPEVINLGFEDHAIVCKSSASHFFTLSAIILRF